MIRETSQKNDSDTEHDERKVPGPWVVEKQDDGSWWVLGPDPHPEGDEFVLVAACEQKVDAERIADLPRLEKVYDFYHG